MKIKQIKDFLKEKRTTKDKSDEDWCYDQGYNQALKEIGELEIGLDVEKVDKIIKGYFGYKDISTPVYNMSFGCELSEAIVKAFENGEL